MKFEDMNLLIWDDTKEGQKITINTDIAFLFTQSYGFPVELFEEEVNRALKDPQLKAYHVAKAFDKAKGTNYSQKVISSYVSPSP